MLSCVLVVGTAIDDVLYVHVVGAVHQSGVYELPIASRVFEAINAAGGLTDDAAVAALNQARFLEDGEKLYVPTETEIAELGVSVAFEQHQNNLGTQTNSSHENRKVNINTASLTELTTLSGIGTTRAQNIIQHRERVGAFESIQDLMNVDGISTGIFQKIADDITI